VHDYEGTVNEMTGDGIMALFGAPIALEDAPQRAIRSAHAIHREMSKFSDKTKQEKENIPPIKMRIGIHTGPVVVGTLGNDLRVEFKAVGDTVNLASRMEGLAAPGATFVSDETFKLTEGFFRFEALGAQEIKGKEEIVNVFRVIAPSSSRTRFDVSAERGLTPFVGKQRELELLLDGFERAKAEQGQAISIMAEAGVGKSRLLYEFRKAVSNEDVIFQEGKCLSYSKGVANHPIIDIVKSNSNIKEGDGDADIREKLKRGLSILGVDEASTLPYFLELLSVKDSGVDPLALSPDGRKDRIIEALNRSTIKASQIRPLIMAIEDLHWIDKSSEDTLKALLDRIAGERIFLIFTYRPEYVHTWGTKSYHSQITLNRLSNRESLTMVNNLLGSEDIESDLEKLILEKTEGIPFFIEEFIKSLKDLKFIEIHNSTYQLAKKVEAVSIPSTIQDVIMARVDALSEEAKEVIQTGSVIEREFSYVLIKQVMDLPEQDLLSRLSILKDSELLFERGIYPDSVYIFKHALTREVVYDSILTLKKKELHNKIGQSIVQVYKDNLHEHYGVLAEHFISSENYDKGAEYCKLAGRKAEKAGSLDDAIAYGEKQVACIERLPQTEELEKNLIDARTKIGLYNAQIFRLVEAKTAVDPIVNLALNKNYKKRISQIFIVLAHHKGAVQEDIPKAVEYAEKALKIGRELNDFVSLAIGNTIIGFLSSFNCEFTKSLYHYEKTLEINVTANSLWGISFIKAHLSSCVYYFQGRIDLAYQTSTEALQIANKSGDIFSKAFAHVALGLSYYGKGYFNEAKEHLTKSADLSEKNNLLVMFASVNEYLGQIYFDTEEYKTSQKHHEVAISTYRHIQIFPSSVNVYKIVMARAKIMNNEKDYNLSNLFKNCDDNKLKRYEGWTKSCIGEILLNIDDQHISEAEEWINKAIEFHKKYSMMWYLAKDYALYAELFKRKEDLPQAREKLSKAIEIFKECGADGWVDKYEKELASV
jgi:tetratricopeptide (TPR) repeat protein